MVEGEVGAYAFVTEKGKGEADGEAAAAAAESVVAGRVERFGWRPTESFESFISEFG